MISLTSKIAFVLLASAAYSASPTVTIIFPTATIVGKSANNVDSFLGIPFAQPPTATVRLHPPIPLKTIVGEVIATNKPLKCPQGGEQAGATDMSEDCLTLDVQRPSGTLAGSGLPVVFWIYGGGFTSGGTSTFDATKLIQRSVVLGGQIVYVAANYRLGAFGWLPGQEVVDAGIANLGLLDQRLALEWVADNIAQFGGDPAKVTIWGESAGSASVFDQMALYNGNNIYKGNVLFRGAIMNSGSIVPAEPVNGTKGQAIYETVVNSGGCSDSNDTLTCLRALSFADLLAASDQASANDNYASLGGGFKPRPDGVVLTDSPEVLVNQSQYAKVPFIIGDEEDEGTLFAQIQKNVTNTTDVINYFSSEWFPQTPRSTIAQLVATYPNNPAAGSPFRTGSQNNEPYAEYKRMAAIIGDLGFTLLRRVFLTNTNLFNPNVPSWSYLGSQYYGNPIYGTRHASDVGGDYGGTPGFFSTSVQTYYISFINTLDPNTLSKGFKNWPRWSEGMELLWFKNTTNGILADNFRNDSYAVIYDETSMFRI